MSTPNLTDLPEIVAFPYIMEVSLAWAVFTRVTMISYQLEDIDHAKAVIAYCKEDEMKITEWAAYAVGEALKNEDRIQLDYMREVIQAEAHTARNCRAWQLYGEETGDMDVWIEATAKTANGFIEIGAYLSDIWQTGATPYKQHMYIQYYKRAEL